jgi:C4-dicarboxylate transporter DctQ subunit
VKFLDHLEEWFVIFLIAAATLIIFAAVGHRYASGLSIPGVQDWLLALNFSWAQELCIIMFVWMAKFGAAYGVRTGIHVGVDVLINRLDDRTRSKFIIFGLAAGAFFTGIVGALGAHFVWENGLHYAATLRRGIELCVHVTGPPPSSSHCPKDRGNWRPHCRNARWAPA